MPAVSNTTPLRYLIAIELEQVLPKLFREIIVPRAVHDELMHPRAPGRVRQFLQVPPPWYTIGELPKVHATQLPVALDKGEKEAILLAEFLRTDVLLIDDRIGRSVALSRHIPISGTVGVLESADAKGLLDDFPRTLKALSAAGFYLSETLEEQLLTRHRIRHRPE